MNKVSVLIIGAGPAGLAAAISLKKARPELEVCVLDKAAEPGNHNLSGAVLEPGPIHQLLDLAAPNWRESDQAKQVLARKVEQDDVLYLLNARKSLRVNPMIKMGKFLHLSFGNMDHHGDYIVSISRLTRWLAELAQQAGVELYMGFSVAELVLTEGKVRGVKLADQGLDREGKPQPNYLPGEEIHADMIVLAEGCDGLITEKFVAAAGLTRQAHQLFSVGIKEVMQVTPEQYQAFGNNRVVHAMGWPIWVPFAGPNIFGGGIMYSYGENQIAVGMIVGADWQYTDFNPQEALVRFKEHPFVRQYIDGAKPVAAGAKMIPEGGWLAVPRHPAGRTIGHENVVIMGDAAGFVNMTKIKGLHNAIASGLLAAQAAAQSLAKPQEFAQVYTNLVEESPLADEMMKAENFRQTVAKLGPTIGFPLSALAGVMPLFKIEPDYKHMKSHAHYPNKLERPFDKDSFTALAATHHREEQPCHCTIIDPKICENECAALYGQPCLSFCPAGVYERIQDRLKAANPSNCLHCKTCQRKCPCNNLRWNVPEGAGGPKYKIM